MKGETVKIAKRVSELDGTITMAVEYPLKQIGWGLSVFSRRSIVLKQARDEITSSIIMFILVMIFSTVSALMLAKSILLPIDKLKIAANTILTGDYSARTNITGRDEIADTAQAFDKMAESIEQYDILKSQFFSNISHELKTPINVISATAQLLTNQSYIASSPGEYHARVQKYMGTVKQNCYRLMRLVTNLIDITRFDSGFLTLKLGNHNIVQLVENITLSIVKFAETRGIEVIFDTDTEEKTIACDPDSIERIILNLISNAVKFTGKGGSILVLIYDRGDEAVISVKDTGIGIPKDKLDMIFDRFGQVDGSLSRNHEGSGIGLSLVKVLVEAHKGTISVKSEVGKGAEFTISLPAYTVPEQENILNEIQDDTKSRLVERINIEFSDIYSLD